MSAKGRRPLRFLFKLYARQRLRRHLNIRLWRGRVFAHPGPRKTWPGHERGMKR